MDASSEANFIAVKTANVQWHRVIFIAPVLLLSVFMVLLVLSHSRSAVVFMFFSLVLCFGCYFLANYLTKSDTNFRLEYGVLTIEQTNNKLKKDMLRQFEVASIRGFEINRVKSDDTLIIYLTNNSYYRYPLFSIKGALELEAFLESKITKLTTASNPNFRSFWPAFLFALRCVAVYWIFIAGLLFGAFTLANNYHFTFSEHKLFTGVFFPSACILGWFFLIHLPVKNKKMRYMAFTIKNFLFLGISIGLVLAASLTTKKLKDEGITIANLDDLFNYPNDKLFFIKNVSYSAERNLFSTTTKRNGGRSNKFTVDHLFVTPIISPTNQPVKVINFWISKTYTKRIPLAIPKETKDSLIKQSWAQARATLISDLQRKPQFYTILYNKLTSTKKFFAPYELIKYNQFTSEFTTILEPHWESIEAYKREVKNQLLLMFLGMAIFNIIAAIFIAVNR